MVKSVLSYGAETWSLYEGDGRRINAAEMDALTLILLAWTIWRAPTNASKWRMGFNPYPANVDNIVRSYQCRQMADGI